MKNYIIAIVSIITIFSAIIFTKYRKKKQLEGLGKVTDKPPRVRIIYSRNQDKFKLKRVKSSAEVHEILKDIWSKQIETREEMIVLLLDRNNQVLGYHILSMGGITGTVADLRLLFAVALKSLATSVIMSHNHPSGNLNPSQADIALTRKVKEAGEIMDITLLDHIIITKDGYYSMADEGNI